MVSRPCGLPPAPAGLGDPASAEALLQRLLVLGAGIGAVAGAAVFLTQGPIVSFFTHDAAVVAQVGGADQAAAAASCSPGSKCARQLHQHLHTMGSSRSQLQCGVQVREAASPGPQPTPGLPTLHRSWPHYHSWRCSSPSTPSPPLLTVLSWRPSTLTTCPSFR